ncbi:MAG: hypothetical protein ACLR2E_03680 [Lachnospiraceae bacterium]
MGAAAGLAYKQVVGAESAVDINLAKQLNVLLTQLGVDGKSIVMNVGSAAAGYGFEYAVSTMDRIKQQLWLRAMQLCRCRSLLL